LKKDPFPFTAHAQGQLKANEFSFKLAQSGSEMFLGGADSQKFTGAIEFHPVVPLKGFWQITGAKVLVGGSAVVSNFNTIIDTGTTIILGPVDAVDQFYSNVPGSKIFDPASGLYSLPCDAIPSVSFSWGGKNWPVSAEK
jgi:cathepsin D